MTRREVLFPDLDAGWQDYIHGLEAHMDEQDATIAALVAVLQQISDEADEFDDHDGRCGHIKYSTLVLDVRGALLKAAKEDAR